MNHDFDEEKCRETCDICWGDGGQQWPCAKAAGVCARSPGRQAAGSTPALVTSSAATPVVPPSKSAMIAICAALGFDPTNHHPAERPAAVDDGRDTRAPDALSRDHSSDQRTTAVRFLPTRDGRAIALLRIEGDFASDEQRHAYTSALCDRLNRDEKATP